MRNKKFTDINASSKIVILIFLILMLFITNSIYLILFISTLTLILLILSNKSVKEYVIYIKNIILFLLFIILVYIIIFRKYSFLNIMFLIYKIFVSAILVKTILLNLNFDNLHSGIYSVMNLLKRYFSNLEAISFEISISIYYLKFYFNSKTEINKQKLLKAKKKNGIKYTFFPRLILADNQIKEYKNYLKLNFYKMKKENKNLKSNICVITIIIIFIVAVFKEVIG